MCSCVLFLAASGRLPSRVRFCAPHPFLWPFCPSSLSGPLRTEVARGSFVWVFLFFFVLVFSSPPPRSRPGCLRPSVLPGPWCPRPVHSLFCSASPPRPFFFSLHRAPLSRAFRGFLPWVPWAFALCGCPPPPCSLPVFFCSPFFFPFSSPFCLGLSVVFGPWCPAPLRFVAAPPPCPLPSVFFPFCGCLSLFCWCRAVPCPAVLFCAVSCCVWRRRALLCRVLSWCAASSGRWARAAVFPTPPPSCCPLGAVARPPAVVGCLCSVLGCGAVFFCCAFCRVVAAVSVGSGSWCPLPAFALAGALCRCLWLLGACRWVSLSAIVFLLCALSPVLLPGRVACCPAVCCGVLWPPAPLCGVLCSAVLSCRVVPCRGALLSVLLRWRCWFMSFPCVGGAVLRCVVCAVLCRFGLCCRWRLALWCAAVCGAVSLGVLWCGGAALLRGVVCRGVLLRRVGLCGAVLPCAAVLLGCAVCSPLLWAVLSPFPVVWCAGAVSCGVLRPVLCPAVLCCLVGLCWLSVLCYCLGCWLLFFLSSSFASLPTPAVFPVL